MNKKTVLLVLGLGVGGCCLFGTGGLVILGLMAPETPPAAPASAADKPGAGGDTSLGGYVIWGSATPTAEGFAGSLVGNWMLMDGASSIESIERISDDVVKVRSNRSGELWHFSFEGDGSYAFRYVVTYNRRALISTEKGEWSSNGAQLTLTPSSCTEKTASETNDCTEPTPRTYALTTVRMEELTPNDRKGITFEGVRFTGPTPKFASGANNLSYLQLQRVR